MVTSEIFIVFIEGTIAMCQHLLVIISSIFITTAWPQLIVHTTLLPIVINRHLPPIFPLPQLPFVLMQLLHKARVWIDLYDIESTFLLLLLIVLKASCMDMSLYFIR